MIDDTRDIAVEARTLARQAHDRQDEMTRQIDSIHKTLTQLSVQVASLNTKVAVAAGAGSLLGGGAIAVLVTLVH